MKKALFWFRRDLRMEDNCGLYHCLHENDEVVPVFIFDQQILNGLPQHDKRVEFIWLCVAQLKKQLNAQGSDLRVEHANPDCIVQLAQTHQVTVVYCNEDYEPAAMQRDITVKAALAELGITFKSFKDTVIFAKDEILTQQDKPYHVYTPYKNAWRKRLESVHYLSYPVLKYVDHFAQLPAEPMPSLASLGFEETGIATAKIAAATEHAATQFEYFKAHRITHYKDQRDIPSINGTSFLSVHLRFGTISIRKIVREVIRLSQTVAGEQRQSCETWLDELIWREFFFQVLFHYPHAAEGAFKREYADFPWQDDQAGFQRWCLGQTGYPLIDAAMIQLNTLGYMHNRLRMLTASFLIKLMQIDYRWGERYFALKLLDFDLAANNGGWQWSASTGCDAQPFFRIFNPISQSQKFDPEAAFIKKYLPIFAEVPAKFLHAPWLYPRELQDYGIILGQDYPLPVLDYAQARLQALQRYEQFTAQRNTQANIQANTQTSIATRKQD